MISSMMTVVRPLTFACHPADMPSHAEPYRGCCIVPAMAANATGISVDLEALARVGRALADDTRRRILAALLGGPSYPSQLADVVGTTKANVSNHLACLRGCGLVTATYEGRHVRYAIDDPRLAHALEDLAQLVADRPCPAEER